MRTKEEILNQADILCRDSSDNTIMIRLEEYKLEALLDIRNILDDLTVAIQNIATLRLRK